MLDDTTLFHAGSLPPAAPLPMPRQVLERSPRRPRFWLRLVLRLSR